MTYPTEKRIERIPWFKQWFDTPYYHKLYANHDDGEARSFLDALIGQLGLTQGSSIIDIGCGKGRHSKYLASKGFDVTGIDLSLASINEARKSQTPSLNFVQHDMRHPFGKNRYDYVFNFFTSFGYFKNEEENNTVIRNTSDALKPKGMLVLDYLNVAYAENHLVPEEEKEIDGIVYHLNRWMNNTHFFKKITIGENVFDEPIQYTEQVSKLNLDQFEYMLALHDLEIEEIYGDYHLSPYNSQQSPRLIILARKSLY